MNVIVLNYFGGYLKVILSVTTFPIEAIMIERIMYEYLSKQKNEREIEREWKREREQIEGVKCFPF